MRTKIKILSILCLILLLSNCELKKDLVYVSGYEKMMSDTKYYKDYPEFYNNRRAYELNKNSSLINKQLAYRILQKEENKLTNINIINLVIPDFYFIKKPVFKMYEFRVGTSIQCIFFKYLEIWPNINSDPILHIEYPLTKRAREKMMILVWEKLINKKDLKAAYIHWISDKANMIYLMNYDVAEKYPIYMWGINKSTDTLYSNLSKRSIKLLFPEFRGEYIYKNYSNIELDYQYSLEDNSFFENIEFIE